MIRDSKLTAKELAGLGLSPFATKPVAQRVARSTSRSHSRSPELTTDMGSRTLVIPVEKLPDTEPAKRRKRGRKTEKSSAMSVNQDKDDPPPPPPN